MMDDYKTEAPRAERVAIVGIETRSYGSGFFMIAAILVLLAAGILWYLNDSKATLSKDRSMTEAAEKVGAAADKVGAAAEDAVKKID